MTTTPCLRAATSATERDEAVFIGQSRTHSCGLSGLITAMRRRSSRRDCSYYRRMVIRPVAPEDLDALIGVLAILEGEAMLRQLDNHLMTRLNQRLRQAGFIEDFSERDTRQGLSDLAQRLHYATGAYDALPAPMPVPELPRG